MRDELKGIRSLMAPGVIKNWDTTKHTLVLKEPKNAGTGKLDQVTLMGVPAETVVFTLDDAGRTLSNFLAPTKGGHNKGCDYVIATHDGERGWLLICEMKSGNPRGFMPQLKSGDAYAYYLDALLNHFGNGRLNYYKRRHILFHQRSINKRLVGKARFQMEKKDKLNFISVDRPTLHLKELLVDDD